MFVDQIFEECAEILGTTDEKRVYRKITQAVQTLMESGHWMQSTADVDVCTGWDGCTVALPRGIDVPLAINVDGSPVYFRNRLFQYHVNKGGKFNTVEWAWDDRGYVATLMQIVQPSQLVAIAESENDVGKIIRVTGTDSNNRDLRSQLKDGTGVDGLLIPIHSQSDFAYGTIAPDDATIRTREVTITPISKFTSATPHTLDSGQGMAITAISGTIPVPLSNGQVYYIGVLDALTIQIYNDSLNAQAGNYPISLQSIVGAGPLKFLDSRTSFVVTALQFASAPTIEITTANPITFPSTLLVSITGVASTDIITSVGNIFQNNQAIRFTFLNGGSGLNTTTQYYVINKSGDTFQVSTSIGGSVAGFTTDITSGTISATQALPIGLRSGVTYFGNLLDSTHLQVFNSISDAQANVNEIHTTGSTNPINVDIRKEIVPETKLTFSVNHLLTQGDQVQVFTSGGTLPQPLIANQNYFVNIVDTKSVSIHTTQADALSSSPTNFVNPIKLTSAGSGTVSLVKLIQAASRTGTESQITASGLALSTPSGAGAQFQAVIVGSVTGVSVTAGGSGYLVPPNVTFSSPPQPPTGSTIEARAATGYALIAGGAVTSIVITDGGFGYINAPAISIDSGTAKATSAITTSFVSGFTRISGGFGYDDAPQVKVIGGGGSGATGTATINSTINQIVSPNLTFFSGTVTCVIPSGHGYFNGDTVEISGVSNDETGVYNRRTTISVPTIDNTILATKLTGTVGGTTASCNIINHGFVDGQIVTISGVTGAGQSMYNGSFSINVIDNDNFQYQTLTIISSTPATGPMLASIPNSITFKYSATGTGSTPPTATGTAMQSYSGSVIAINTITTGTGYVSRPSVIITPSTGVFVQFSATGTLPSPLVSGTAYRAETPLNGSTGTFTVKNSDFSDVNITSSATGTFYVVLSRAFGVSFTNKWLGDFTNLTTPSTIYWGTDYLLPTTNPSIDNGSTPFYLNVASNTLAKAYDTEQGAIDGLTVDGNPISITTLVNLFDSTAKATTSINHGYVAGNIVTIRGAIATISNPDPGEGYNITRAVILSVPAPNQFIYAIYDALSSPATGTITVYKLSGLINVVSFGTGQSYYAKRFSVSPLPYNNLIQPSNVQFLQENESVKFSTSGVLPVPLVALTDYQVKVIGDSVNVYSGGVLVPITTPGTGQLALDIQRTLNVSPSTSIVADASLYTTGQSVTVRANSGDVLPDGLVAGTTYFIRRIDNNEFELYDTKAQSQNLSSVVGRREFLTSGLSTDSKFFVDAIEDPILVKSVANIQKPLTDGFVSLYAMDYGRSNDLTLIGQYHPQEVNPQYRRIRIGKPCAWVRIAYRIKPPVVTSKYDYIPIEHTRAIITAVHACDLEDKDFSEQALRYWGFSLAYLKNQQEHQDGHAFVPPQINNETYGDGSDPVMF